MSIMPTTNSAVMRAIERKGASGVAHSNVRLPMLQAVMYSVTLKAVPMGSTPFTNDEKRNTTPTNTRATTFSVQFSFVSFILDC